MNNNRIYYSHTAEEQIHRQARFLATVCLLIGAGIGAAVTFFVMPDKKRGLREQVAELVENGVRQGGKVAHTGMDKLGQEYSTLREAATEHIPH